MRIGLVILFIFCFQLLSQSQNSINSVHLKFDSTNSVILPLDAYKKFDTTKNIKSYKPSKQDFKTIDSLMKIQMVIDRFGDSDSNVSIKLYDSLFRKIKKPLEKYLTQMIFFKKGNEKFVLVNSFCDPYTLLKRSNLNWKEDFITIYDGGYCYLKFDINLNTKTAFNLLHHSIHNKKSGKL